VKILINNCLKCSSNNKQQRTPHNLTLGLSASSRPQLPLSEVHYLQSQQLRLLHQFLTQLEQDNPHNLL